MEIGKYRDLIAEYESDDKPQPAALYVTPAGRKAIQNSQHTVRRGDTATEYDGEFYGYPLIADDLITEPRVLPLNVGDCVSADEWVVEHPPRYLLEQLVDIEITEYSNPARAIEGEKYRTEAYLRVTRSWLRWNREMVRQYGYPAETANLQAINCRGEAYDEEPNDCYRVKFGHDTQRTEQIPDPKIQPDLVRTISDKSDSVESQTALVERTRTFKMPYPVLDIQHREKLRFGTSYKLYDGVCMVPPRDVQEAAVRPQ